MADPEHVMILQEGVTAWNIWREKNPNTIPGLKKADLRGANLQEADLHCANLQKADLRGATLTKANLRGANLTDVKNFTQAQLNQACVNEHTKLPKGLTRPAPCPEEKLPQSNK